MTYAPAPWEPFPRGHDERLLVADANGEGVALICEREGEHAHWMLTAEAPAMYAALLEVSAAVHFPAVEAVLKRLRVRGLP